MFARPDPPALIRRLHQGDDAFLQACLADDHGLGLFIQSNYLSYGFSIRTQYWGQFNPSAPDTLDAVLIIVAGTADLYMRRACDIRSLARVAMKERVRFIMGADAVIDQIVSLLATPQIHLEPHIFAELPKHRFRRQVPPLTATIRRAQPEDVPHLVTLYNEAKGFEGLGAKKMRHVMHGRVTHMRTFVATIDGEMVSAASTSAESDDAAMIGGVWTPPRFRGTGCATAVVSALCAELLAERRRPYLFYLEDNAAAAHIYSKIGFRETGSWKVLYFS